MRYLLDTNICIYIIKRKPEQVFRRFQHHRPGDIGMSAITYSELCYGADNSARPEQNHAHPVVARGELGMSAWPCPGGRGQRGRA